MKKISRRITVEAKALVYLAFRTGPIESVHGGKICPTCDGHPEYRHITDSEMKEIMKAAVNMLATLLELRSSDLAEYERQIVHAMRFVEHWDSPEAVPQFLLSNDVAKKSHFLS